MCRVGHETLLYHAILVSSLSHVKGAITNVQTFTFTFQVLTSQIFVSYFFRVIFGLLGLTAYTS